MKTELGFKKKFNDFRKRYSNWSNLNKNKQIDSMSTESESEVSSLQRSLLLDFESIQITDELIETIDNVEGRSRADSSIIKCQSFQDDLALDNSVVFTMNGKKYIYNFSDDLRKSAVIYQDTSHVAPDAVQEKGAYASFRKFGYFAVLAPVESANWDEVERKINFYKSLYEGINIAVIENPDNPDDYRIIMDLLPGIPVSVFTETINNNNCNELRKEYQFFNLKTQLIFIQKLINEIHKVHEKNLVIVDLSINNILFGPTLEDENLWSMSASYDSSDSLNADDRFRFYLIDGGACTFKNQRLPSEYNVSSETRPYYVAPECYHQEAVADVKNDVYSFGCLLEKIFPVYSKFLLNIIEDCKSKNPENRLDFSNLSKKISEKFNLYKLVNDAVFNSLAEINQSSAHLKIAKRRVWKKLLGELQDILDNYCLDNNAEIFKNLFITKLEELKSLNRFENLAIASYKSSDIEILNQEGAQLNEMILSSLQTLEELVVSDNVTIDNDEALIDEIASRYTIFENTEQDIAQSENQDEDNSSGCCKIS